MPTGTDQKIAKCRMVTERVSSFRDLVALFESRSLVLFVKPEIMALI
jgi:hypothetical protein